MTQIYWDLVFYHIELLLVKSNKDTMTTSLQTSRVALKCCFTLLNSWWSSIPKAACTSQWGKGLRHLKPAEFIKFLQIPLKRGACMLQEAVSIAIPVLSIGATGNFQARWGFPRITIPWRLWKLQLHSASVTVVYPENWRVSAQTVRNNNHSSSS